MAGLYDVARLTVVLAAATPGVGGEPGTPAETDIYYFRVARGFYAPGAIATATGLTVVDAEKAPGKALTPIKELIRAGVLKSSNSEWKLGTVTYRIKLHYDATKESTLDAGLAGALTPTTGTNATKSLGATYVGRVDSTRVTGRS